MYQVHLKIVPGLKHLFKDRLNIVEAVEEGESFSVLISRLAAKYPKFGEKYFKPGKTEPSGQILAVVNGIILNTTEQLNAPMKKGSEIMLMVAYNGG